MLVEVEWEVPLLPKHGVLLTGVSITSGVQFEGALPRAISTVVEVKAIGHQQKGAKTPAF